MQGVEHRLGDLCDIAIGRTPDRGNPRFWDREKESNNVWLSIADMINTDELGFISDSKEYVSNEAASNVPVVKNGTLLMSFKLTVGRLAFAGTDLRTNEAIAALPVKESVEVHPRFLYYQLQSMDWTGESGGASKVMGRMFNKKTLAEIPISVPTLEVQHETIAYLDALLSEIQLLKDQVLQAQDIAKQIRRGAFLKAFGS